MQSNSLCDHEQYKTKLGLSIPGGFSLKLTRYNFRYFSFGKLNYASSQSTDSVVLFLSKICNNPSVV